MQVKEFDFDLPEKLIALRPVRPRDSARLLHVREDGKIDDSHIRELGQFLRAGDALVVNTTRVIPARLVGHRASGGQVEVTLIERLGAVAWRCFLKPAKKIAVGDKLTFDDVEADVAAREDGEAELHFRLSGDAMEAALARLGKMPLPPYISRKRTPDARDAHDYQTLFAKQEGAVAAPTAGLHFTKELVASLERKGVVLHRVTLHVGAGTFLPVRAQNIDDHKMHAEWGEVTAETAAALNAARKAGGRIVCVGTTALRLLESAADADGVFQPFAAKTDIFITPGYRFRAADLLLTNFHLPRSTLFMLVAAFVGLDVAQAAYAHAIHKKYRFYSYGDACLLERAA